MRALRKRLAKFWPAMTEPIKRYVEPDKTEPFQLPKGAILNRTSDILAELDDKRIEVALLHDDKDWKPWSRHSQRGRWWFFPEQDTPDHAGFRPKNIRWHHE